MADIFTPIHLIFYAFAAVALASAVAVITVRNPVRSVLSLVVTFFAMAGIWMMLNAEFLSIILVLVYVGAVMTLFLFVVMMLNIDTENRVAGFVRYLPLSLIVVVLMTAMTVFAVGPKFFGLAQMPLPQPLPEDYSNVQALGMVIFTQYAYAFEVAGVLLLAAIIAAITLTHRGPVRRKVQNVDAQLAVRPEDRVTLVNLASEPKRGE